MCWSCDSPDEILLDKNEKLDINKSERHSFFLALRECNNVNSRLQERAMIGGPLKMPM
jgi:hypothetical protein